MGFSLFDLLENALGGDAARQIDAAQQQFASLRDSWGQDLSHNVNFFVGSGQGTLSDMVNGLFDGRALDMAMNPIDSLQSLGRGIGDIGNAYGISGNGIDLSQMLETSIRNPISTFFLLDGIRGLSRVPGAVARKAGGALARGVEEVAGPSVGLDFQPPLPRGRPVSPKRLIVVGDSLDFKSLDEVVRASGFAPEEIVTLPGSRLSGAAEEWASTTGTPLTRYESKPSVEFPRVESPPASPDALRLETSRNPRTASSAPDYVRLETGAATYADGAIVVTDGSYSSTSLIERLQKAGKPVYVVDLRKGFPDSTGGALEHLKFTDDISPVPREAPPDMSGVNTRTVRALRPGETMPEGAKILKKNPDGSVLIEEMHKGGYTQSPPLDPVQYQMEQIKLPKGYNPDAVPSYRPGVSVETFADNLRARSRENARLNMLRRTDPAAYAEEVSSAAQAASSTQPLKVVIAGTRTIDDVELVRRVLQRTGLNPDQVSQIVSGTAKGVDTNGATIGRELGIEVKEFRPKVKGKFDPFRRNQQMADYGDAVVAVWDGKSTGTADMIGRMRRQGKPVWVYNAETGMVEFPDGTMKPLAESAPPAATTPARAEFLNRIAKTMEEEIPLFDANTTGAPPWGTTNKLDRMARALYGDAFYRAMSPEELANALETGQFSSLGVQKTSAGRTFFSNKLSGATPYAQKTYIDAFGRLTHFGSNDTRIIGVFRPNTRIRPAGYEFAAETPIPATDLIGAFEVKPNIVSGKTSYSVKPLDISDTLSAADDLDLRNFFAERNKTAPLLPEKDLKTAFGKIEADVAKERARLGLDKSEVAAPPPAAVASTPVEAVAAPKKITTTDIDALAKKYQIDPETGELYYMRNAPGPNFGMGNTIWGDEARGARVMNEPSLDDIARADLEIRRKPLGEPTGERQHPEGTRIGRKSDDTLPPELITDRPPAPPRREIKRLNVFVEYIGEKYGNFKAHPLANPFKVGRDGATKAMVLEKYRSWLLKMYEAGKNGSPQALAAYETLKRLVSEYKGGKQFVFTSRETGGGLTTPQVLKSFIEYLAHSGKPLP